MFCKECGVEVKEEWKNCPNCGANLKEESKQAKKLFEQTDVQTKKISKMKGKWKKWIIIIIIIVVLYALFQTPSSDIDNLGRPSTNSDDHLKDYTIIKEGNISVDEDDEGNTQYYISEDDSNGLYTDELGITHNPVEIVPMVNIADDIPAIITEVNVSEWGEEKKTIFNSLSIKNNTGKDLRDINFMYYLYDDDGLPVSVSGVVNDLVYQSTNMISNIAVDEVFQLTDGWASAGENPSVRYMVIFVSSYHTFDDISWESPDMGIIFELDGKTLEDALALAPECVIDFSQYVTAERVE